MAPTRRLRVISATEIWATVPALTPGTAYTIRVTNVERDRDQRDDLHSPRRSAGGACAPTITSFTPTCGSAGDGVVITGTNLLEPDPDRR